MTHEHAGIIIQERGEMLSLTDMWRAAGGPKNRRPANWLAYPKTGEFVSFLEGIVTNTREGARKQITFSENINGTWNTWAHRLLAMAYFDYLAGPAAKSILYGHVVDFSQIIKALNEFEVPDDISDMFVYAIREKDTGNIKIGISRDPLRRLCQLQTGNSSELELIAYKRAKNSFSDEAKIHADAEAYRIRGEWFESRALDFMQ